MSVQGEHEKDESECGDIKAVICKKMEKESLWQVSSEGVSALRKLHINEACAINWLNVEMSKVVKQISKNKLAKTN